MMNVITVTYKHIEFNAISKLLGVFDSAHIESLIESVIHRYDSSEQFERRDGKDGTITFENEYNRYTFHVVPVTVNTTLNYNDGVYVSDIIG